jgi:hypothetical protein
MTHPDPDDHGPSLVLARSDVGSISLCPCGVVTLTLQYLSVRFEPAAFRELQGLLALAQRRIDAGPVQTLPRAADDGPPVH